jgi:hypothetical protein
VLFPDIFIIKNLNVPFTYIMGFLLVSNSSNARRICVSPPVFFPCGERPSLTTIQSNRQNCIFVLYTSFLISTGQDKRIGTEL